MVFFQYFSKNDPFPGICRPNDPFPRISRKWILGCSYWTIILSNRYESPYTACLRSVDRYLRKQKLCDWFLCSSTARNIYRCCTDFQIFICDFGSDLRRVVVGWCDVWFDWSFFLSIYRYQLESLRFWLPTAQVITNSIKISTTCPHFSLCLPCF